MKSFSVFLCGTQADLAEERSAVLDAVSRVQLKHESMEFFGARSGQPIETCLEEVRRSDILVVVVGHRYGTFVPNMDVSFTEAEYREGHRLGKPCLVYIRGDEVPVLPRYIEQDPAGMKALKRFKGLLMQRHTVARFRGAQDLAVGVAADLGRTAQDLEEAEVLAAQAAATPARPIMEEVAAAIDAALAEGIDEKAIGAAISRVIRRSAESSRNEKPLVFLSHTHADKVSVLPFAEALRSHNFAIWIDEEEIDAGQSLLETVSRGLHAADAFAFFVSSESLASNWVRQELSIVMADRLSARGRSPVVIPILLESVDLPPALRDVKYIDLRDGDAEAAATQFAQALERHLEGEGAPLPPDINYYVVEKSIHSLRSLLHVRRLAKETEESPSGLSDSLDYSIRALAKAVGGLCGLSIGPENRLHAFVEAVMEAGQASALREIFARIPELKRFLVFPYFS